jgi:hypothetical protein
MWLFSAAEATQGPPATPPGGAIWVIFGPSPHAAISRPNVIALPTMKKTSTWVVLAALCTAMLAAPALAQNAPVDPAKAKEPLKPPTPSKPDEPPLAMTYISAVLVVGLMAFAALIPSKRGHQD